MSCRRCDRPLNPLHKQMAGLLERQQKVITLLEELEATLRSREQGDSLPRQETKGGPEA